ICATLLSIYSFNAECYAAEVISTSRQEADNICRAYISNPKDFAPAQTYDCKIRRYAGEDAEWDAQCYDHNGTTYAGLYSGGTDGGSAIISVDNNNVSQNIPISNVNVNGYGFATHDKILTYNNDVYATNGSDLRLVENGVQTVLCTFLYKATEWTETKPLDLPICQSFENENFTQLVNATAQDAPQYPEAKPLNKYLVDIDSDGTTDNLISYHYASGAGAGCNANPLLLSVNNELIAKYRNNLLYSSTSEGNIQLGEALQSLTLKCNQQSRVWSPILIADKNFIMASNNLDDTAKSVMYPYLSKPLPDIEIYEYVDSKFVKICSQTPKVSKHIAHKVLAKEKWGALNYTPIE
ncbi:MAG: hypothetical protein VXY16_07605, partial [Pseudomonadota bacterium]|nr:hypothetical protein [Pseudomonadota bacterium]